MGSVGAVVFVLLASVQALAVLQPLLQYNQLLLRLRSVLLLQSRILCVISSGDSGLLVSLALGKQS